MRLKVGIVGCGLIAQIAHIPNLLKLTGLYNLKSICDMSSSTVETVGKEFNISNLYQDYHQLLKDDIDVIFILTRDHYDIAMSAIEAGKQLFIEKPIAFNSIQAKEIVNEAKKRKVSLMVGYMRRFDSGVLKAKSILSSMNDPKMIRYHSSLGSPDIVAKSLFNIFRANDIPLEIIEKSKIEENKQIKLAIDSDNENKALAYRLLIHLWIHEINLLRDLFGIPVDTNYSLIKRLDPKTTLPACQIVSVLDYGNGNTGIWESQAFMKNEFWDDRIEVYGSEQTVKLSLPNPYLTTTQSTLQVEKSFNGEFIKKSIETSIVEKYQQELIHFYEAINNKIDPLTSGEEAVQDLEIAAELVRKSNIAA